MSLRCRLMRGWLWPRILGRVLDVDLAAGQQRQDAQARRLQRAQGGERMGAGQAGLVSSSWAALRHKDMFAACFVRFTRQRSAHFDEAAPRAAGMHKTMRRL